MYTLYQAAPESFFTPHGSLTSLNDAEVIVPGPDKIDVDSVIVQEPAKDQDDLDANVDKIEEVQDDVPPRPPKKVIKNIVV